jgi:hypothetical protein
MIELLESRIAPAGIVEVIFRNGGLMLKSQTGDGGDEALTLTFSGPDSIMVTPDTNVALSFEGIVRNPGQALTFADFHGNLSAALGGGRDTLRLVGGSYSGNVNVNLGEGENTFIVDNVAISGSLKYRGGTGGDAVEFRGASVSVGESVAVSLGNGGNSFAETSSDFHVGKDFSLRSGVGNDAVIFSGAKLTVPGSLVISTGEGSDTVQILASVNEVAVGKNFTIAASGSRSVTVEQSIVGIGKLTVGGGFKMTAGTGDRVTQIVSGITGEFSVGGSVYLSATNPTIHTQLISSTGASASFGASVKYVSNAITANQTFSLHTTASPTLAGALTVSGGTAILVDMAGTISGAVALTASAKNNSTVALSSAEIAKAVSIVTKDSFGRTASVSISDADIHGAVSVRSGVGATTLAVEHSAFGATFAASLGDGANHFNIEQAGLPGATVFHAAVSLSGGSDADTFVVGGTTNNSVEFLARVIADGRGGTDSLTEGDANTHPAGLPLVKKNIP